MEETPGRRLADVASRRFHIRRAQDGSKNGSRSAACLTAAVGDGNDPTASPCLGPADAIPPCASTLPSPLNTPGLDACVNHPTQEGCGMHCAVNDDFVRLGALSAGAVVHATVRNDALPGSVTVSLGRYDSGAEEILVESQLAHDADGFFVQQLDATVTSAGEYHLVIAGAPADIVFALSASVDP